ncbi:hypothetical protein [Streptomyces sp. NPDC005438]|uniref:hypothetical protein n=1 Tax=Streptomyces sp. NPDC005438 TaxID=3156880 RepID=UPI0033B480DB
MDDSVGAIGEGVSRSTYEVRPEFDVAGVGIGRWLQSLTRAGQVQVRDGRLQLLTSYGREIDSAPLEEVRFSDWYAAGKRTLARVGGTRYLLRLEDQPRRDLRELVRVAHAKAEADRGSLGD